MTENIRQRAGSGSRRRGPLAEAAIWALTEKLTLPGREHGHAGDHLQKAEYDDEIKGHHRLNRGIRAEVQERVPL